MLHARKLSLVAGVFASLAIAASTFAASPIVVTPSNQQGWSQNPPLGDTRPGGAVNFVVDGTEPHGGLGALQLTTDATTAAKANYMHAASTPLTNITELSYETKQNSASFPGGDASYQLAVCLGGVSGTTCNGFTTLVYEPYENGVVMPTVWQSWDVDSGMFWSSRSYTNGTCTVAAGAGGAPFYSLSTLQTACPSALVVAFGVNVGTFNPSYNVETDYVSINGQAYDFEPYAVASNKNECKDGGWTTLNRADGSSFKNQGDCIQYTNTGK